jgi:hypothetical protein
MGGGYKWGEAKEEVTRSQWFDFRSKQIEHIEYLIEHPGYFDTEPYNMGLRSRGGEIESPELPRVFVGHKEEDRPVMYKIKRSSYGMWITDKKNWYGDVYWDLYDKIGVKYDVHFPDTLGGASYALVRDLMQEHGPDAYECWDGKRFDAGIGLLTGKAFSSIMTPVMGINVGASGCIWTNMNNEVGTLALTKDVTDRTPQVRRL